MTPQAERRRRVAAVRPGVTAAAAVALGLSAGWARPGSLVPIAVAAVLIAAANGYSKAYSP